MNPGRSAEDHPTDLVVDPTHIRDLRSHFADAVDVVQTLVNRCQNELHVAPAMGDPASADFADYLNDFHTGPTASVLSTLTDYFQQLQRVIVTLDAIDLAYPQNEADVVEALTRATS